MGARREKNESFPKKKIPNLATSFRESQNQVNYIDTRDLRLLVVQGERKTKVFQRRRELELVCNAMRRAKGNRKILYDNFFFNVFFY